MLAKVNSLAVFGIDAYPVEVEVEVAVGLPAVVVVGLPDVAVRESKDRVKSAIVNSGYAYPTRRITVNLAPADVKKEGPAFDLPMALGMLAATQQVGLARVGQYALVGELALDGALRAVRGCLSMAMACRDAGLKGMVLPRDNGPEAAVVEGIDVIAVASLAEAVGFLNEELPLEPLQLDLDEVFKESASYDEDFSDVKGQAHAKRALTVAAAGAHNLIMIGPPGAGKTMLSRRLPSILPLLTPQEALETTRIYSVSGLLSKGKALLAIRPFRAPHHTVSDAGLIGGGAIPRPGEISLAHHGVLFLDELPEFNRAALEALRQPLEDGTVTISRVQSTMTYPTDIMLVAAMNPCPCGFFTDPRRECHCTPRQIKNYLSRISGPLLDRIDVHVEVPAVHYQELASEVKSESSRQIRSSVMRARQRQMERFRGIGILTNSRMTNRQLKDYCPLDEACAELLGRAMSELRLSARAYHRIIKVARTIADLEGTEHIIPEHIAEAVQYRCLDRAFWT